MCETCGCNLTERTRQGAGPVRTAGPTQVMQSLLAANDRRAAHNRAHFDAHGVTAINLMSSPGAGKTSLLEATAEALDGQPAIAVIEGDLATANDARRLRRKGITAIQINTGSACHLDAEMVHDALHQLDLAPIDVLFIENVGNLVCPASFDLGQHFNVALLSAPEGDDKPAKYPVLFRTADAVLLTKSDLIEVLGDFDPGRAERCVRDLANPAPLLTLSSRSGAGFDTWLGWLSDRVGVRSPKADPSASANAANLSDSP